MSRYVQTFLPHERAILNNMFFQPSLCHFTRADEGEPVDALWTNSLCEDHSFAGPGQRLARIRCGDVMAFREIWIRGRAAYRNSNQPLRGRFAPSEWVKDVGGWWVGILRYRTFKLFLYSKTPRRALEFSTGDIDQVLTSCVEKFQGDEMPTCTGQWTRGAGSDAESMQWHLQPNSRWDLEDMIKKSEAKIKGYAQKELAKQCDILIALRGLYRPVRGNLGAATLKDNKDYNSELDDIFTQRLRVSMQMVLALPQNGMFLAGEYAQKGREELVGLFLESRGRFAALNCAHFQIPSY